MKKTIFLTSVVILCSMIMLTSCSHRELKFQGFINPGAKDSITWVKDELGFERRHTVEVVLQNGEKVEAVIPNFVTNHYVRYRDYPPAKGKSVFVVLQKNRTGEYIIMWGGVKK